MKKNENEGRKKEWIGKIGAWGIVSFLLICFLLFVFVFSFSRLKKSQTFLYRFLEVDPEKKSKSTGTVSIYDNLKKDEFLSYQNKNGKYVLISNFGSKEYICSGSCVCEEEEEKQRRNTGVVLKQGMIYLVAAISSFIAFEKAKTYFYEDCKSKFSEICSPSAIKAEIYDDRCIDVNEKYESKVEDYIDDLLFETVSGPQKFWCHGHCVMEDFENEIPRKMAEHRDCGLIQFESEIILDDYPDESYPGDVEIYANLDFQQGFLDEHCKDCSQESYYDVSLERGTTYEKFIHLCNGGVKSEEFVNPTIMCKKISEDSTIKV